MAWWLGASAFAAGSTGLLLTSLLTPGTTGEPVFVFLPLIIGLSIFSIVWQLSWRPRKTELYDIDEESGSSAWSAPLMRLQLTEEKVRPSGETVSLLMAPSLSFLGVLFLRLVVGEDHFDGEASQLDFGPLHGIEGEDANKVFGPGSIPVYTIMGTFCSLLSFPAVQKCITDVFGGRWRTTLLGLSEIGAAALTIYPSFFLIKFFWDSDGNFATSSYVANSAEWALGYALGMATGFCVTVPVQKHLWFFMDAGHEIEEKQSPSFLCHGLVKTIHFTFGVVMVFTACASAILFGATWNTCVDDATDCVNYASNGEFNALLASSFLALPIFAISMALLREWYIARQEPPYGESA